MAEVMVWNRSLTKEEMKKVEDRMRDQYECPFTKYVYKGGKRLITTHNVELLPSETTRTLEYEFPEVLPTFAGCGIAYRAFSEDKQDVLFTNASSLIKIFAPSTIKDV